MLMIARVVTLRNRSETFKIYGFEKEEEANMLSIHVSNQLKLWYNIEFFVFVCNYYYLIVYLLFHFVIKN